MSEAGDWTPVFVSLRDHPKLLRLADALEVPPVEAAGHLVYLWTFARLHAPDGDLSRFRPLEIARAAAYLGDAELFVRALQRAGFLDRRQLHDWSDAIEVSSPEAMAKAHDRERKRAAKLSGTFPDNSGKRPEHFRTIPENVRNISGQFRKTSGKPSGQEPSSISRARTPGSPVLPVPVKSLQTRSGRRPGGAGGPGAEPGEAADTSGDRIKPEERPRFRQLWDLTMGDIPGSTFPPRLTEVRAGRYMLARWSTEEISACWAWYRQHGTDIDKRNLCWLFLRSDERVGNWLLTHGDEAPTPDPVQHGHGPDGPPSTGAGRRIMDFHRPSPLVDTDTEGRA